jgi:hypothetical protein
MSAAFRAAAPARSAMAAPAPVILRLATLLISQLAPINFSYRSNRGGGGISHARGDAMY